MYILGLNSVYHESAVCLIKDGQVLFALEEERLNRRKHGKVASVDTPHQLPWQAIEQAFHWAEIGWSEIERIGFSFDPQMRTTFSPEPGLEGDWGTSRGEETFLARLSEVPAELSKRGFQGKFDWWSHHLCHAASVYFASGFPDAALMVVDGIAEHASSILGLAEGQNLELFAPVPYPHSLGFLWEYLSQFLGFSPYDAAKVMGMAAQGDPATHRDALASLIWPTAGGGFELDSGRLPFRHPNFEPLVELFDLPAQPSPDRLSQGHFDLAAALQERTDEILLARVRHLHQRTRNPRLCLSGGVALNCVSNRVLFEEGPFEEMAVLGASHDAGTAVGAAALSHHEAGGARLSPLPSPYTGPSYPEAELQRAISASGLSWDRPQNLATEVAQRLDRGEVVGWFQGRVEFGPRALGNRSILADPRRADMRDKLNRIVKHREEFRPFAPSVLAEELENWFQVKKPTPASQSMLVAYPVREERRARIPAVVHSDGTSRVQSVEANLNPLYHQLICEFQRKTDVPLVLNTSFNDREPIVCRPEDALATFCQTPLDALALGPFLVTKS